MLGDRLTKLTDSSRKAISVALVLIVAIAMYNWIVAPHVAYLRAVQRYEPVVVNIAKENTVIDVAVRTRKKKLEELHLQFEELRATLFTLQEVKEFFGGLQALCEEAGCPMISLNFLAEGRRPGFKNSESIAIAKGATLRVVGGYDSIISLVKKLQDRTQKVWIDSLNMEVIDVDSGQLRCDITITVYAIRDNGAVFNE